MMRLKAAYTRLRPLKFDLYVYHIDYFFGEPSFVLGKAAAAHIWLRLLISISYGLLPTSVLAIFAAYVFLRREAETLVVAKTFVLNLFLAVPLYLLLPVCGPAFAFSQFPLSPPPTSCLI